MRHVAKFQDLERSHGVRWEELAEREPELRHLLHEARRAGAGCRGWSDVGRAFGPFRDGLVRLVGFAGKHRDHPVLGTVGAYEVSYWRLYDAVAGLLLQRTGLEEAGGAVPAEEARRHRTEAAA
jgi:hypothetical protein